MSLDVAKKGNAFAFGSGDASIRLFNIVSASS